ncbi:glycosyltransferase family 1 protein [Paenibacillus chitinolyticus]|uniref:glycosyltransferase family 1 protein n=1 Tax=Paenibacillus chitinolyticus TaxID=79263 RepID=UPI0000E5F1C0|nr:glycosyltransferase family 1 protein [Paenibacillus chitinolyticus]MEC0247485.1 glycosyltransferase family 1 protein [Paenibacillus chitinolyticus]
MKPIRILHVVRIMNRGGAETLIMNLYRQVDRSKIQFDFAVSSNEPGDYDSEIGELGGRIITHPHPTTEGIIAFQKSFLNTLRSYGPYQAVHSHVYTFSGFVLKIAKKENIPVRVAHCHTTKDGHGNNLLRAMYRWYARKMILTYSNYMIGCSKAASEALFGKNCFSDPRVEVLANGIDLEPYRALSNQIKSEVRSRLGLPVDGRIIGHIGRFSEVKNHKKIIEIFECVAQARPDTQFVLVGDGPLRATVEEDARSKGLEKRIHFMGVRKEIPEILKAMDVFLMPSLFEGVPVVLIEAQASGLPCVVSNTVTKAADLKSSHFKFLNLEDSAEHWADEVIGFLENDLPEWGLREKAIQQAGYDIRAVVNKLSAVYM